MDHPIPWHLLTRVPLKASLYARETYFREGLADAQRCFGSDFEALCARSALLMVKPDGLMAGKAAAIVDFIRAHGYSIVAVESPTLTPHHWRELWRHQLTSATLDRLAVNDLVFRHPALMLLLLDDGRAPWPATVRLSTLKGPSDVTQQSPDCLRYRIGQPNRVFSYFHVADEPADLLRELGVLLDGPARRRVMGALRQGRLAPQDDQRWREVVACSSRNARRLDAAEAIERVARALETHPGENTAARTHLHEDLERMRQGQKIAWLAFADALARTQAGVDLWDLATLGANFIVCDEPGHAKQLVAGDPSNWRPPLVDAPVATGSG